MPAPDRYDCRMKKLFKIFAFAVVPLVAVVALVVGSCTAAHDENASGPELASTPAVEAGGPGPKECPPPESPCPEIYAPSLCVAKAYRDEPLPPDEAVRAWGDNSCTAKFALMSEACKRGMSPAGISGIECVPDVSRGKCPFARTICTMDVSPKICTATKYADQQIPGGEKGADSLSATGSNECDARNNLMQTACIKNLDPEKIGGVKCRSPKP